MTDGDHGRGKKENIIIQCLPKILHKMTLNPYDTFELSYTYFQRLGSILRPAQLLAYDAHHDHQHKGSQKQNVKYKINKGKQNILNNNKNS